MLGKIKTWAQIVAISSLLLHNIIFAMIPFRFDIIVFMGCINFYNLVWLGLFRIKIVMFLKIQSNLIYYSKGRCIGMNAEIIAVGSELLLGQIMNTNARFLSQQLAELGINVYYHTVVGDNPDRLKSAIEIAEKRAEIIIFSGGLGPTKDDLTKETIAKSSW